MSGESPMDGTEASITLIVRVRLGPAGQISGIVERVKTGEKRSFRGTGRIGGLIVQMLRRESRPLARRNET